MTRRIFLKIVNGIVNCHVKFPAIYLRCKLSCEVSCGLFFRLPCKVSRELSKKLFCKLFVELFGEVLANFSPACCTGAYSDMLLLVM